MNLITWVRSCVKNLTGLTKKTDGGSAIQQELGKRTGATSVPRVFIAKESIGGCDGKKYKEKQKTTKTHSFSDTQKAHRDGKLSAKLASAGAIKN